MKQQLSALFSITKKITATIFIMTLAFTAWATGDESMIIDVRTLEEWNAGHLETAQHLQLDHVAESIETLMKSKDQQVYLYCRSGNRSGQAKIIMDSLGYTNVVNAGGLGNASELLAVDIVR